MVAAFALVVLVGTLYPIFVEWVTGDQVGAGRPFFDRVAVPIAFLVLLAIGTGATAPWRVASGKVLWQRTRVGLNVGLACAALTVLVGVSSLGVVAVVGLAGFVIDAGVPLVEPVVFRRRFEAIPRGRLKDSWRIQAERILFDPDSWNPVTGVSV